jgi:hypothetical protein
MLVVISSSFGKSEYRTNNSEFRNGYQKASTLSADPQLITQFVATDLDIESMPRYMGGADVQGSQDTQCEDVSPQGCPSEVIGFQPVCTKANISVDLRGGSESNSGNSVTVQKNSKIELWRITSPLALLSGKDNPYDSTYEISKANANFRSANQLIDQDLVAAQFYAPTDRSELEDVYNSADTGDFSVHVSTAFGGIGGGGTPPNEATISPELDTVCPDVNTSDPNPDAPNKISNEISNSYSSPTKVKFGRNYINPNDTECVYIDPQDVTLPNSEVFDTCVLDRRTFDGVVSALYGFAQWGECLADKSKCEEVEVVGLLIDAPFGGNHYCEEGFCADQYYDNAVSARLDPERAIEETEEGLESKGEALLKGHYVTTPCRIRVDYGDIYEVPCLWDVSPYKAEYELNLAQSSDPDFPTWEEYWYRVEAEAERRGAKCGF